MKKNILILVLSVALIFSIGVNIYCYRYCDFKVKDVSNYETLLTVLANPDRYNGRIMTVEGVLSLDGDCAALYLSKEHAEHHVKKNAIYLNLEFTDEEYEELLVSNGEYVNVKGLLDLNEYGPDRNFSGMMKSIEKCE